MSDMLDFLCCISGARCSRNTQHLTFINVKPHSQCVIDASPLFLGNKGNEQTFTFIYFN